MRSPMDFGQTTKEPGTLGPRVKRFGSSFLVVTHSGIAAEADVKRGFELYVRPDHVLGIMDMKQDGTALMLLVPGEGTGEPVFVLESAESIAHAVSMMEG